MKNLLILLFIVIPVQLAGLVLVAIALIPLIKDRRYLDDNIIDQRLPKWARWFDNADDWDMECGVNGDLEYQDVFLTNDDNPSDLKLFLMRYNWLALRNPANTLKRQVLGIKQEDIVRAFVEIDGQPPISDWFNPGTRRVTAYLTGNRRAYEYYKIYVYPFKKDKCLRIRIGHKLGEDGYGTRSKEYVSWVFSVSPWKSFKGKA